jgi:hypothetical protein
MTDFTTALNSLQKYDFLVLTIGNRPNGFDSRQALNDHLIGTYGTVLSELDMTPYPSTPGKPRFLQDLTTFHLSALAKLQGWVRPTVAMVDKHDVADVQGGTSRIELTAAGRVRFAEIQSALALAVLVNFAR